MPDGCPQIQHPIYSIGQIN